MTIYFCSCLPRSGSTLLLNLLAQNSAIHVTPTNGLAEMVACVRDAWVNDVAFRSQGFAAVKPRIKTMLRGMIDGFYAAESDWTVIDKSRTWLGMIDLLEEVFGQPVKIIVPVRAVEDILASFEKLHRRAALTVPAYSGPLLALRQITVGRCHSYLAPEAHLGMTIARLRDALQRGYRDRLLFVPFRYFTERPRETANWLTEELDLPAFDYDPNDVIQVTHENDDIHGLDLHRIREGPIEPQSGTSWYGVLPNDFAQAVQQEYADINDLASRWMPFMNERTGRNGIPSLAGG